MISSEKSGVWLLDDAYQKDNAGYWSYYDPSLNAIYVVGENGYGELGQNDRANRSSPIQLPGTQWNIDNLRSHGQGNILMTKTDGTLWVWGRGQHGQLGLNARAERSSPVQVPGTQWSLTMSQRLSSLALKTDGTMWVWGTNQSNGLGNNTTSIDYSSPTQIAGTQWNNISKGGGNCRSFFATKTDGTMWSWGYNSFGNLGHNDQAGRSSPKQIPGTTWNIMASGTYHSMHIKTDGTLWGMGYNDTSFGSALGLNDAIGRSSPYQIPGTQWSDVTVNQQGQTYATKTDGTLWVWGQAAQGGLGLNDGVSRSSPTQLPGTQWDSLGSNYRAGSCTKTDGTLWVWGSGQNGVSGQNDQVDYSSPIQIPGTSWSKTTTGRNANIFSTGA